MDLIANQSWASTGGTSGALAAIELLCVPTYSVLYVDFSTLATTNSFALQSAQTSTGPWFDEGSTAISTAVSTRLALRVTGPVGSFIRPIIKTASTGQYNFQFIGVG